MRIIIFLITLFSSQILIAGGSEGGTGFIGNEGGLDIAPKDKIEVLFGGYADSSTVKLILRQNDYMESMQVSVKDLETSPKLVRALTESYKSMNFVPLDELTGSTNK